ncbi:hypothetical protein [Roseospira navarrensis]|uniref:Uncharacterized protein n=1 Tax=Roseospira navarrensis TaxID=140058 RepID=A0A7X2D475_9PROT|nr:hypothetical protein [Roseospira navarrensis]MQX37643.1 hypothetical protein [Roseospira navarrensis]
MIVLGPRDADLGGAPAYWREADWRPDSVGRTPRGPTFPAIPFDRCDLVLEYDARWPGRPLPSDQGWELASEGDGLWSHDARHGVLRFRPEGATPSFWRRMGRLESKLDRGAAHGLFRIDQGAQEIRAGGFEVMFMVAPPQGRARGMRGCWSDRWHWRTLDGGVPFPLAKASAEPSLDRVWHGFGMDAELVGPPVPQDNFDPDDGGTTLGSLSGVVSQEDRRRFGYGEFEPQTPLVIFGMTEPGTAMAGQIRNLCVSFPGRFLRPSFRAVAQAETTRLRLLFGVDGSPRDGRNTAAIRVRYTAPSLGMREGLLPQKDLGGRPLAIDPGRADGLHELAVDLEGLKPGEPLRFTVERAWDADADTMPETALLLAAILEEARP